MSEWNQLSDLHGSNWTWHVQSLAAFVCVLGLLGDVVGGHSSTPAGSTPAGMFGQAKWRYPDDGKSPLVRACGMLTQLEAGIIVRPC